jgi:EAL domain-containing protein (putative c-di-GMP-specific phosphodiesterase class I)
MLEQLYQPGAIRLEFQPIVRVCEDGVSLYAIEALTRGPRGTSMENPAVLFEYARRKGSETHVDMLCIAEAISAAATLPGGQLLSLNVHGSTLSDVPRFAQTLLEWATGHGIAPNRLMLELVEHRAAWNMNTFRGTLRELRDAGVRIALDDLGVGASNYHMFIDCRPDHLKIDRYVVSNCAADPYRMAVLRSIVTLAEACGAVPIAEGVETEDELTALRHLGIEHAQGWLFARSMPAAEVAKWSRLEGRTSSHTTAAQQHQIPGPATFGSRPDPIPTNQERH